MRNWKEEEVVKGLFDERKEHRLKFSCIWDDSFPKCLYIMLNPSTADHKRCDRTLDRCISLAQSNGFGSIEVVNLYSYRTKSPKKLWNARVSSLMKNKEIVRDAMEKSEVIIAAWGGAVKNRSDFRWVLDHADLTKRTLYCYGLNKDKTPKHPLYLKNDTKLVEYAI